MSVNSGGRALWSKEDADILVAKIQVLPKVRAPLPEGVDLLPNPLDMNELLSPLLVAALQGVGCLLDMTMICAHAGYSTKLRGRVPLNWDEKYPRTRPQQHGLEMKLGGHTVFGLGLVELRKQDNFNLTT